MDLIESIKKDKAYLKCKLIVKKWEKDFKSLHSRTPSKFDIKEAPSNIKYAYKKYFQLKSTALENSLSICDPDEESVLSPEPPQQIETVSDVTTPQELLIPTLPSVQELDRLLSSPKTKIFNENLLTDNLSKKLFQNRKFSIRNPRKNVIVKNQVSSVNDKVFESNTYNLQSENYSSENVLNKNGFDTTNKIDETSKESEVNKLVIEGLKMNKSHSIENLVSSGNVTNILQAYPVRQINNGWFERATGYTNEDQLNNDVEKFGLGNIKIDKPVEKLYDYVENSETDDDDVVLNKLKPALKKRKTNHPCKTICRENSYEEVKTDSCETDTNIYNKRAKVNKNNRKKKIPLKIIENYVDHPPDIAEYLPFGIDAKVNPRHNNVSDILETVDLPVTKDKLVNLDKCDKIEKKIQNGTLNDNFVRINIEKKVFVRGRKSFNFSKYKKQLWKDKKALHAGMEFPEAGKITCFKCGLGGHMARYCTAHRENKLLSLEDSEENNMMTLEDMQKIVSDNKDQNSKKPIEEQLSTVIYEASKIPEDFLHLLKENPGGSDIKPVYIENNENSIEIQEALNKFGHNAFRPGQEKAIKRILCGLSTLLILSTGGGKSLCYQLPAYIYSKYYKCITLVISPLVSLMEDQVLSMPDFLKAACIHTNQQPTQKQKIIDLVKSGEINILLISPEALISGDTSSGFAGLFKSLPQIAFACIDEAHCVSQWSHNFRPSYLMICRVLREKLNVKCILGLTATASQATIKSIINHINIPDGFKGVLSNPALPNNLYLSISFEKDKDRALVSFLASETINSFNSIIVYCIRRNECERVAAVIRSCLSQPGKINMEKESKKRKRMSYIAEAYHAGMSGAQRRKIQKHFMEGSLKVIVATVAFGMGIDKSDIRCIVHYNMPPSFESYVQEVGRAGRDGKPAFCHVFMNKNNNDKDELLKHIYANSIDRPVIRKLLQKVFIPCKCISSESLPGTLKEPLRCEGHEVGIPIDETVEELDLPSENIATLLCYVELHHKHYIKVLNNAYTLCKISSYGGPTKILEAAKTSPPLAMAYLIQGKIDPDITKSSVLEFNVIEVAAAIGWESGMTKYQLKNLEWVVKDGKSKRSHLKVEFNTLGFRLKAPGDLSPSELDSVLDELHETVHTQEKVMLCQLEEINKVFSQLCSNSCELIVFSEETATEKSNKLKEAINQYFTRENSLPDNVVLQGRPLEVERVTSDVRALIATYKDCKFTGRSIARIFQGISSPNYPALVWGRCKFWRSHIHEDFDGIVRIATQQIIQMKI